MTSHDETSIEVISEAVARLTEIGFFAKYDEKSEMILGGTEAETVFGNAQVRKHPFSIELDTEGHWIACTFLGQLQVKIPSLRILEAVDAIQKLYETPSAFDDSSMTIEQALKYLNNARLPTTFETHKVEHIMICTGIQSEEGCTAGVSIFRCGGYFVVIRSSENSGSTVLHCVDSLAEAVRLTALAFEV